MVLQLKIMKFSLVPLVMRGEVSTAPHFMHGLILGVHAHVTVCPDQYCS
jgi:hypothetical protein